jgi:lipopolysaccharide transport system ATP-binding protein
MSSDDIVVRIDGLSKAFRSYERPQDRLFAAIARRLSRVTSRDLNAGSRSRRSWHSHEHWALRDVSFSVARGETVGVLGRNGSGKSTLLHMVCGTNAPTSGTVEVCGRLAALLELGTGFSGEFTGRENVRVNATLLGIEPRAVDAYEQAVVAFSEIGDAYDRPVREYSTGMYVRLAFAAAIYANADVLAVDEALAVGDIRFQLKCFRHIEKMQRAGTAIILVTQSPDQVIRHCHRALVLEAGRVAFIGSAKDAANLYLDLMFGAGNRRPEQQAEIDAGNIEEIVARAITPTSGEDVYSSHPRYNRNEYRWGDGSARILSFELLQDGKPVATTAHARSDMTIAFHVEFVSDVERPVYGFFIRTLDGATVYGANSSGRAMDVVQPPQSAGSRVSVAFKFRPALASGEYALSLGVARDVAGDLIPLDRRYDSVLLTVANPGNYIGVIDLDAHFFGITGLAHAV